MEVATEIWVRNPWCLIGPRFMSFINHRVEWRVMVFKEFILIFLFQNKNINFITSNAGQVFQFSLYFESFIFRILRKNSNVFHLLYSKYGTPTIYQQGPYIFLLLCNGFYFPVMQTFSASKRFRVSFTCTNSAVGTQIIVQNCLEVLCFD